MKKMTTARVGWLYAFIHFSLEFACFYFLYSRLKQSDWWWVYALVYDALAFLPQTALGVLSDKFPKVPYATIGCFLVGISLFFAYEGVGLIVLSIGNALVHIDGAQHTLRNNQGKIAPNSIFVAGGAVGLILGQLWGLIQVQLYIALPCILLIISAVIAYLVTRNHETSLDTPDHIDLDIAVEGKLSLVVVLVILAVAMRAFVAYAIPMDWNKTQIQAVALFVFMAVGKAVGGVLADKIGYRKTTYISLLFALPFLMFGNEHMWLSLFGVMLFSMTMPITVAILCSKYPRQPGLAFGITTFGLFIGMFPKFFLEINGLWTHRILTAALCICALVCIIISLKKEKKHVT